MSQSSDSEDCASLKGDPVFSRSRPSRSGMTSPARNGTHKKVKANSPEIALEGWMVFVHYETQVDPYRGLFATLDQEMNYPSLWKACTDPQFCPTIASWKKALTKAAKRKRNNTAVSWKFTGRPTYPGYVCRCDGNPFCFGTMGGVMNILVEKYLRDCEAPKDVLVIDDSSTQSESSESINLQLDPRKPNSIYSDNVCEQLKSVRQHSLVSKAQVQQYLRQVMQDLLRVMKLPDCIDKIDKMHANLIFRNPLLPVAANKDLSDKVMALSTPPGLENLGATCYLNTQLQCLAQNLVFVRGIFNWTAPESGDAMSSVLVLLQRLLAELLAGHRRAGNTLEFSNALQLDHYEQQDPNEFSRLLLERMHESFQSQENLQSLLPDLFRGVMEYETECLECHATSVRTEDFMDLNLTIEPLSIKKTKDQQSILAAMNAPTDTNVQHCLDSYEQAEYLEGDNQYFCGTCQCKRDAKRSLHFTVVPPVLNIQLCRYVFDRTSLSKKKLSNKVLLPRQLKVKTQETYGKHTFHQYVLCAVMRHQGTSAYSGHYVAEVRIIGSASIVVIVSYCRLTFINTRTTRTRQWNG
jgi:ubiquitin C-terminal hydrolase